jgi:hypothetical protein
MKAVLCEVFNGTRLKCEGLDEALAMDIEEYRKLYPNPEMAHPGWDAIDRRLSEVYPGVEPRHYLGGLPAEVGGDAYLSGVSVYECASNGTTHYHFVTYGLTELFYCEEAVGGEFSRFGFELNLPTPPKAPWWKFGAK